jgi:hypothetical protein
LDFFDTFSPVAKLTTVRLLLAVASIQNWHLHQLDVNNAFLHGDLKEDVYMSIPDGVHTSNPNQVCKLLKSLYGLKQASRKWYEKLTSLLVAEGYIQSTTDHSLFTITSGSNFTALLVYVDDIILAGNCLTEIDRIKLILDSHFKIKDLGSLKYFLGLEVAQSREGITISQRKYCLDLLKDSGLLGSKPSSTPLDPAVKLHNDDRKPYADISQYRRLIGKLLYLTNTRPDIYFATQQLSQFLSKPTINHYNAACRVIRYLKHNQAEGCYFLEILICKFWVSQMLTGQVAWIQENPQQTIVSLLVLLWCHGKPRNRLLYQDHLQRQSTEHYQVLHVNSFGYYT